jgi:hypothetical protein
MSSRWIARTVYARIKLGLVNWNMEELQHVRKKKKKSANRIDTRTTTELKERNR